MENNPIERVNRGCGGQGGKRAERRTCGGGKAAHGIEGRRTKFSGAETSKKRNQHLTGQKIPLDNFFGIFTKRYPPRAQGFLCRN